MSHQDNTEVARGLYEAFNDHDLERAGALAADDVEFLDVPTGRTTQGPEGFMDSMRWWIGRVAETQAFYLY